MYKPSTIYSLAHPCDSPSSLIRLFGPQTVINDSLMSLHDDITENLNDITSKKEEKTEQEKLLSFFLGMQDVDFESLVPPDGDFLPYRLRRVDDERATELAEAICTDRLLKSHLTVVRKLNDQAQYVYIILDGNHRYAAMVQIRSRSDQTRFPKVSCRVYNGEHVTKEQCLAVAFTSNKDAENVKQMTEYERVSVIRKLRTPGDNLTKTQILDNVYDILNITTVSTGMRTLY